MLLSTASSDASSPLEQAKSIPCTALATIGALTIRMGFLLKNSEEGFQIEFREGP